MDEHGGAEDKVLTVDNFKGKVWRETKIISRVTFPAIIGRVSSFGIPVVTQIFIGHISELDLAAYGLISSVMLTFINGVLVSSFSKLNKQFIAYTYIHTHTLMMDFQLLSWGCQARQRLYVVKPSVRDNTTCSVSTFSVHANDLQMYLQMFRCGF